LENLGVAGRIILKGALKTFDERALIGFIWLRIGTSVRLL
jgi:hypothetical protein